MPWLYAGSRFLGGGRKWYRAGGAPAPVAVYVPKGAASLAASYVNLANPGTYDITTAAAPTWAAAAGWIFNGNQRLRTGITTALPGTWSVLIRFAITDRTASRFLFGENESTNQRWFVQILAASQTYTAGSGGITLAAQLDSGVIGIAGTAAYHDGTAIAGALTGTHVVATTELYIGDRNPTTSAIIGNIQAVAIYNTTLTAPMVAAISTAMAAL